MRVLDINGGHIKRGIDWGDVARDDLRPDAVYVKLTEGQTYTSRWAEQGAREAHEGGFPIGFYHFARPDTAQGDPLDAAKEAKHYLETATSFQIPISLPWVLDIERAKDWEGLAGWADRWIETIADATGGYEIFLYASPRYLRRLRGQHHGLEMIRLWIAHYGVRYPRIPEGLPWSTYALHQYTSRYVCDGLRKRVDVSRTPPMGI